MGWLDGTGWMGYGNCYMPFAMRWHKDFSFVVTVDIRDCLQKECTKTVYRKNALGLKSFIYKLLTRHNLRQLSSKGYDICTQGTVKKIYKKDDDTNHAIKANQ